MTTPRCPRVASLLALFVLGAAATPAAAAPLKYVEAGLLFSSSAHVWEYTRNGDLGTLPRENLTLGLGLNTVQGRVLRDRNEYDFEGNLVFVPGKVVDFDYTVPAGMRLSAASVQLSNYVSGMGTIGIGDAATFGGLTVPLSSRTIPDIQFVDSEQTGTVFTPPIAVPAGAGTYPFTGSILRMTAPYGGVDFTLSLSVEWGQVPEPAALGTLVAAVSLVARRRRRA